MDVSAGLGLRFSRIEQFGQEDRFKLFFIPAAFNWDTSDKRLDPSTGGRTHLETAPYYDISGKDLKFIQGYGSYIRYVQMLKKPSLILAARGILGAMAGADVGEIPADIRFYAGGSGTIRGYAYQSVGPLLNGEPTGGKSIMGLSLELRTKLTDSIGFVVFLDGANVYESSFPDFSNSFRWGMGPGFRYFTPIGPLRLDVGFPLERREGIDDSFQIYISLGQAF